MKKIPKGALLTIIITLYGGMIALVNQSVLNNALQVIMKDFAVSNNAVQWLTTGFSLVMGIVVPITAFLIQRFSTKSLFAAAMGFLVGGTLLCAIAPSFGMLLTGRIIQAIGAGIILPLAQTLIFILVPVSKRGLYMGIMGLALSFAPAIAPVLIGWLVEKYSWHLIFYGLLPSSTAITILGLIMLKNVSLQVKKTLDWLSVCFSTIGFGGLLYGFSNVGRKGWGSAETLVSLAVGTIALVLFVWRQLTVTTPLLELRVFKSGAFTIGTVISMVLMIVMLSSQLLLPLYMQNMLGYSAFKSGLMLLPGAIVLGIMSPVAGGLFDKLGAKLVITIGLVIITVTSLMFAQLTEVTSYTYLIVVYSIRMVGISLTLMPSVTSGMNTLSPDLIPHGIPVNTTMRTIAGSFGMVVLVTIMTNTGGADIPNMIHGMNVVSLVTAGTSVAALVLTFCMKRKQPEIIKVAV